LNVFEFVIVLVVAVLAFKLWETHMAQKRVASEQGGGKDVESKLNSLEERIQVLERIVTDPQFELRRQFKDLEGDTRGTA